RLTPPSAPPSPAPTPKSPDDVCLSTAHPLRPPPQRFVGIGDPRIFALGSLPIAEGDPVSEHPAVCTLMVEIPPAHRTGSAGHVKRPDDAVPLSKTAHLGARFLHHAHILVPDDRPGKKAGNGPVVEVQIGTANRRRLHANNRIRRLQNLRIGHCLHSYIANTVKCDRFHAVNAPGPHRRGKARTLLTRENISRHRSNNCSYFERYH